MAYDKVHLLLVAFPLLVLASDFYSIFLHPHPPPQKPHHHHHHSDGQQHHHYKGSSEPVLPPPPKVFGRAGAPDSTSLGGRFHISFCASCSYKKTALETRTTLMNFVPGTEVLLTNYPPPLPKRLLIKLVPVVQFAGIALVVGGEHIFPRLGYASPPLWYNYLRQNRFGAAAAFWIIGNVLQNTLQSTGAFEIYFDGDLIFSKLKEGRFPSEIEVEQLVSKTLELKLKTGKLETV